MIEGENTFYLHSKCSKSLGYWPPSKEMAQVGRKRSSGAVMEGLFLLLRAEVGSSSLSGRGLKAVSGIPQPAPPRIRLTSLLPAVWLLPLSPLPGKTLTWVTNNHMFSS